jgi:hypothetical protein
VLFKFPYRNVVCIAFVSHVCHMSCPFHNNNAFRTINQLCVNYTYKTICFLWFILQHCQYLHYIMSSSELIGE